MARRWKVAQHFEINWWKRYLKNKTIEDYSAYKTNYWNDFIPKLGIEIRKEDKIFNAGCGPAGIYIVLDKTNQIEAIDPLLSKYDAEIAHFDKSQYSNTHFQEVCIEDFKSDARFEKVFCLNVINHVIDIEKSMDVLANHTASDGHLVLSIDAHNYSFYKHWFRLMPYLDILHPHQYDLKEYSKMLTDRGFSIEKTVLMKKRFLFDYYVLVAKKG